MQIIRKDSSTPTPWKNGGGITHELIRVPAAGDSFRWRVSVAHIDASGPFSDFAHYNRKMVLLRGAGVALKFANGQRRELRQIGEMVEFDGGLSAYCELLGGPCVDLNLMVSKSTQADVRVAQVGGGFMLRGAALRSTLIFSIEHPLLIESDAGESARLEPWDLAVLGRGGGRLSQIGPGNLSAPSAVFFATIAD